ncbi:PadR family transcriptional regulator [Terrabacter carboxydivorans]|uniref:Helix-turn-helix transcriptional regulator n=1 Tax=Terrabacter carboxydivorans TaxID=619730 RepID=A0ABN3LG33_9MICO
MSVKQGLLALLAEEPMYGARLRSEFEARTGGTWPLNVGQVYTTLARLERDGLVEPVGGSDDEGRIAYRLTAAGQTEIESWWLTPVDRDSTPRDELVIKLALAVTAPEVDVQRVVQTQRTATLKHLRDLTRLKSRASDEPTAHDLAWLLVLENLLFAAEAEVRWLDHVESTLSRMPSATLRGARPGGAATEPDQEDARRAAAASKGGRS